MVKAKIQRSTRKGKKWMVKVKNPCTWRQSTIHGWVSWVKTWPKARGRKTAQAFDKRHGKITTPKKYVNKKLWDSTKVWDTINIPNRLFKCKR